MNLLNRLRIVILICLIKIEVRLSSFKDLIKKKKTYPNFLLKPYLLLEPEEIYNSLLKYKNFFNLRCLHLAIILSRILHVLDIKHEFIIGAKFVNGTFKSHAWIESENFKIRNEGYIEIYSYER